jgi:uncharacterized protein
MRKAKPKVPRPLRVELAITQEQIRKGLLGRRRLGSDEGMLFVQPGRQVFWMPPGMRFALDFIWLDDWWNVVDIARNLRPGDSGYLLPDCDFSYVLEVKAGYADKHGIVVGSEFRP